METASSGQLSKCVTYIVPRVPENRTEQDRRLGDLTRAHFFYFRFCILRPHNGDLTRAHIF